MTRYWRNIDMVVSLLGYNTVGFIILESDQHYELIVEEDFGVINSYFVEIGIGHVTWK